MGIVNVTPDSFSDGGKFFSIETSFEHSDRLLKDGADILDIGGESSRPGAKPVSIEEEMDRVFPLLTKINSEFPHVIISIDTTKAQVAEEAIKAGANIINDISGLTNDKNMVNIVANYEILSKFIKYIYLGIGISSLSEFKNYLSKNGVDLERVKKKN